MQKQLLTGVPLILPRIQKLNSTCQVMLVRNATPAILYSSMFFYCRFLAYLVTYSLLTRFADAPVSKQMLVIGLLGLGFIFIYRQVGLVISPQSRITIGLALTTWPGLNARYANLVSRSLAFRSRGQPQVRCLGIMNLLAQAAYKSYYIQSRSSFLVLNSAQHLVYSCRGRPQQLGSRSIQYTLAVTMSLVSDLRSLLALEL